MPQTVIIITNWINRNCNTLYCRSFTWYCISQVLNLVYCFISDKIHISAPFEYLDSMCALFDEVVFECLVACVLPLKGMHQSIHAGKHQLLLVHGQCIVHAQPVAQVSVKRGLVQGTRNSSIHKDTLFAPHSTDSIWNKKTTFYKTKPTGHKTGERNRYA